MHEFCFYLDWAGISSSEWAAWVQAVGSVLAILFAGYFPIWHQSIERGRQMDNYIAMIAAAIDYGYEVRRDIEALIGKRGSYSANNPERLTRLLAALDSVRMHELPHWSLLTPLERTGTQVKWMREHLAILAAAVQTFSGSHLGTIQTHLNELQEAYDDAAKSRAKYAGRTPYARARSFWLKHWRRFKLKHFGGI